DPQKGDSNTPNGAGSVVTLQQSLKYYHFGSLPPTPSQLCTVDNKLQRVACGSVKDCTTTCSSVPSLVNFSDPNDQNYGIDERAEVGLVSRNIKLTATLPSTMSHAGGDITILAGANEVTIQGVEIEKFGKDELGRYPIHFHHLNDITKQPTVLVDSNS